MKKKTHNVFKLPVVFLTAVFVGVFFFAPTAEAALVGHWMFDEGSGSTAADSSGNGNTITLSGATWTVGQTGSSLSFNGTTAQATLSNSVTLGTNHTVAMWLYAQSGGASYGQLLSGTFGGDGIYYEPGINKINFYYQNSDHYPIAIFNLNSWNHVAVVTSGGTATYYINGTASGSSVSVPAYSANTLGTNGYGEAYQGRIDDLRIYDSALTASEVSSLAGSTPPPNTPTASLSASPTSITSGQSSTLSWSSTNATSCTATGGTFAGSKATSGSQNVSPTSNTTYTITCSGAGGTSPAASASVTVSANPVPTASLSASPTSISSGGSSMLTWSSTNATSCTATGGTFAGSKATSGSQNVSPTSNTTYTITCSGAGGTSPTASASVTVSASSGGTPLRGWIWSAYTSGQGMATTGVGWISLNCLDLNDCSPSYSVNIASGSSFPKSITGYAWSDNIGWIKFGGLDTAKMPNIAGAGTSQINAQLNSDGTLSGWARALAGCLSLPNGVCNDDNALVAVDSAYLATVNDVRHCTSAGCNQIYSGSLAAGASVSATTNGNAFVVSTNKVLHCTSISCTSIYATADLAAGAHVSAVPNSENAYVVSTNKVLYCTPSNCNSITPLPAFIPSGPDVSAVVSNFGGGAYVVSTGIIFYCTPTSCSQIAGHSPPSQSHVSVPVGSTGGYVGGLDFVRTCGSTSCNTPPGTYPGAGVEVSGGGSYAYMVNTNSVIVCGPSGCNKIYSVSDLASGAQVSATTGGNAFVVSTNKMLHCTSSSCSNIPVSTLAAGVDVSATPTGNAFIATVNDVRYCTSSSCTPISVGTLTSGVQVSATSVTVNTLSDNRGGWDGWISLKGTVLSPGSGSYGVKLTDNELVGRGWGGKLVTGWLAFQGTGAPTNFSVTTGDCLSGPSSSVEITLTWDRIQGATGYKVYRTGGSTPVETTVGQSSDETIEYPDTLFTPGANGDYGFYEYSVTALYGTLESTPSESTTIEAPDPCTGLQIRRVYWTGSRYIDLPNTRARYDNLSVFKAASENPASYGEDEIDLGLHTVDASKLSGYTITGGVCTFNAVYESECTPTFNLTVKDQACPLSTGCVRLWNPNTNTAQQVNVVSDITTNAVFKYTPITPTGFKLKVKPRDNADAAYTDEPLELPIQNGGISLQATCIDAPNCFLQAAGGTNLTYTDTNPPIIYADACSEGQSPCKLNPGQYTFFLYSDLSNLNQTLNSQAQPAAVLLSQAGNQRTMVSVVVVVTSDKLTCTFAPPNSATLPVTGSPLTFTVQISGGTGPYTIAWSDSDNLNYTQVLGSGVTTGSITRVYSKVGEKSVEAHVSDSSGFSEDCDILDPDTKQNPQVKIQPTFDEY